MIESRLLARLLATARTVTALGAVSPAPALGDDRSEPVRAQVAARLNDGTFRVLVDGKPLKVALPADVKPGDVIELRVMNRRPHAHADAAGARLDSGALSSTGRFISSLLSEESPSPPTQARPILEVPPSAPEELPGPLARALERSGMFYESHQARWVDGDYPLERLLQEPQAGLTSARAEPAAGDAANASRGTALAVVDVPPADAIRMADAAESAHAQPPSSRPGHDAEPQPVAREALALVRSQLEALDSRHVTWLGEIWPGQPMRWEIEADNSGARETEAETGWNTRFSLELPALGEIGADMALGAGGVRLNLAARTPEAAARMRSAAPELVRALNTAGVSPVHFKVSRDESGA